MNKYFILIVLTSSYILNFMDRYLLSMALTDIKYEFGLSDMQLGLLSGLAFAIFYSGCGLFIARLADKYHRGRIIAIAVAVWSLFTAMTAAATNFYHLFIARIGVGVGEAGGVAPAHSLIASNFESEQRPLALSIFQCGATIGIMLASLLGGYAIYHIGWRMSFLCFGLVGIVFAIFLKYTLRDKHRENNEENNKENNKENNRVVALNQQHNQQLALLATLKILIRNKVFRLVCIAQILANIWGYNASIWLPSMLQRDFNLDIITTGYWVAIYSGLGTAGIIIGGIITMKLSKKDMRWQLWLPAIVLAIGFLLVCIAFQNQNLYYFLVFIFTSEIIMMMHLGVGMAIIQTVVADKQRAFAAATCLFLINIFGLAIGTSVFGAVSDYFAANNIDRELSRTMWYFSIFLVPAALSYFMAARGR